MTTASQEAGQDEGRREEAPLETLPPEERLFRMRHSAAHVLAEAVLEMFPEAKYAIGPPIEHGFYYDFDLPRPLTPEDLTRLERRMRGTVHRDVPIEGHWIPKHEARAIFANQPYKLEMIDEIEDETVGHFRHAEFDDLCRGGHTERTGQIGAFALTHSAGAYWRGDERRPMLQRIYGALFPTQEELDAWLAAREEAERRDHRRLGRELELFTSSELVGQGLPTLLPKGATIRRLLEDWVLGLERRAGYQHVYSPVLGKVDLYKRSGHWDRRAGYQHVYSPVLGKVDLYKRSGHWDHYQDAMFPPMQLDHDELVLRPMNCPHHILAYETQLHSYRDLPLRIAEFGTMYRYERSGVVGGLSRVRAMSLNDAHIFCTPDQIKSEFAGVMRLVEEVYAVLGITEYSYRLSLGDPADTEKFVGNDAMWELGERVLSEAMDELGLDYVTAQGEAAFYGPKLDIQIRDMLGREETMSTIQVDFHLPEQFGLRYIGEDGAEHRPVIVHRGVLGTAERMMAYLIELYAGAFPVWLAPVQATVIPIADRHVDYAREVRDALLALDLRVEVDDGGDRMGAKIRKAQLQKVPYMLVVGDREAEANTVSVRHRVLGDLGATPLAEVVARIASERDAKSLDPEAAPPAGTRGRVAAQSRLAYASPLS